ncbi:EAL domain-containing protein [Niveibacterium sp. SC-1]|uniref:EAL domain-containing protein n=1 Tax=Niveibacterium sp. SC-1 TaxID=3135646 RepID=UPI003120163C
MRLLYLEDNRIDADLAMRALAGSHWQLTVARTIAAARALTAEAPTFELILSDLSLPDGTGLEFLAGLRSQAYDAAFVMLTGSGDHESAVAAVRAGADDFLVKHGDYLRRLPQALDEAFARHREEAGVRGRILRVLYVEPSSFDAGLTRRFMAEHAPSILIDVLARGEDLIERFNRSANPSDECDLILLDYQLPGLNALELVKQIRDELHLQLPIVVVTGQGDAEVAAQALRLGVADYVTKHNDYLGELPAVLYAAWRDARLIEASRQVERMIAGSPAVIYSAVPTDGVTQMRWISSNVERVLGQPAAVLQREGAWLSRVHPDDLERMREERARVLQQDQVVSVYRMAMPDGSERWVRDELRCARNAQGETEVVGTWLDITQSRAVEERTRLLGAALEGTRDGVMMTDRNGHIVWVNRAFSAITGFAEAEALGQTPRILRSGLHRPEFYKSLWTELGQRQIWQGELWNRRRNGELYPQWTSITAVSDGQGSISHYMAVFSDISRLKQTEARLERLANYDSLTELPNRRMLTSLLQDATASAERHQERVGVLLIDLDRFKTVNEGLGHSAGDAVLRQSANRMRQILHPKDTLGRLGGDEFLVIVEHVDNPQEAARVAESLLAGMEHPLLLPDGNEVFMTASIGISMLPDDSREAAELIRDADAAMHLAKRAGRNAYRFYTEALTSAANARLMMETRIRHALEHEEFAVWYQPLLRADDRKVIGAEALLRWIPPGADPVSPAVFIPLVEETGLIVTVGEWVLRRATSQAQEWIAQGLSLPTLAVNISVQEIHRGGLEERVARVLEETGFAPERLELEITESGLMERFEVVEPILAGLRRRGVRLSIDDFGTGYSSLSYLTRLPVDKLKIDRSFIHSIPDDTRSCQLASTIIAMARNLKLSVLAEGVETEAQLGFLRERACEYFQGFLVSPPIPAEAFAERFLRS